MDYNYYKEMTHLPSTARWTLIYSSAIGVLDNVNKNKKEIENFKISIKNGTRDAELKFNKLNYSTYNWINEIQNNKEFIDYQDEVHRNWQNIKVQLERYTRLPLYETQDEMKSQE